MKINVTPYGLHSIAKDVENSHLILKIVEILSRDKFDENSHLVLEIFTFVCHMGILFLK